MRLGATATSTRRAPLALVALLAAGAGLAGCSHAATALTPRQILRYSTAAKTVHLTLDSAETGGNDGFNFDGYGSGQMRVTVPLGWTIVVDCSNDSSAFTHSCAVVTNAAPTTAGAPLAFAGAESPQPTHGLSDGQTATFSFVASRVGVYRIACLVTAHELDGMWDWFDVVASGRPSVVVP